MKAPTFTTTQKIAAKHLYGLVSSMTPEQRQAAALLMATLGLLSEDGFLGMREGDQDFFVTCFDILTGVSLALKMLGDDDVIPQLSREALQLSDPRTATFQLEADLAVQRIERQMATAPKADTTHKQ